MKRTAIAGAAALFALASCAPTTPAGTGPEPGATSSMSTPDQQSPEAAEPLDLTGTWKQVNSKADDAWQQATIEGDSVEVNWVSDGGETESLYWSGSFAPATEQGDSYMWDSVNDHDKTDGALFASGDDTKTFSYESGILSWKVTALGTTTTVKAERV